MSSGNSTRDVNLNTTSELTITIFKESTADIAPAPATTVTLADATVGDTSLVADGTGPDLTTCILEAGEGITINATADNLEIERTGVGLVGGTVVLKSEAAAPGVDEFALFNGADNIARSTLPYKKLTANDGTIWVLDDGEFLDLSAKLDLSASGAVAALGDSQPGTPYASVIGFGGGPVPNLKLFRAADSTISVTSDTFYIYIGSNYALLNTNVTGGKALLANTDQNRVVCKTLKAGTNITLSANADQVTITAPPVTAINQMRLAGPDGTTSATGGHSLAFGTSAVANATDCIAIGDNADVTGNYSIGVGKDSTVSGASSVAIGSSSVARALNVAVGASASCGASTPLSVALGNGAVASAASAIGFGAHATPSAVGAVVINDGELSPATNATTNLCRFMSDQFPVFEAYSDHATHYGAQWHDYSNLHVLENFSEKGENPIAPYWLSPGAQLYMPKIRNQDGSPAFNAVSDINDGALYGTAAGLGAGASVIGAGLGALFGAFTVAGALLLSGSIVLAAASGAPLIAAAGTLLAGTGAAVFFSGGVILLMIAGAVVVAGAVVATVLVTVMVAAAIVDWATDLYLQNHAVDWKFLLPNEWRYFGAEMGVETEADFPSTAAWTFEVINKAGQYGKLVFKIEDNAYQNGQAYIEQRDGGRAQSWTNDSGEKQTIGISFVPHATFGYQVRYSVLTGPKGG